MSDYTDSVCRAIRVGDRVRFRGGVYTIKAFRPGEGRNGCAGIDFVEPVHTTEPADETKVDIA